MATNIQWTDLTINPWHLTKENGKHGGHWCRKISPGCLHCYSESTNQNPFFSFSSGIKFSGKPPDNWVLDEGILEKLLPTRPKKIFLGSMTDIFGEWVSARVLDKLFAWMALNHHHTFQILTKRADRMAAYLEDYQSGFDRAWHEIPEDIKSEWWEQESLPLVPQNIWVGASIEDQERQQERSPLLNQIHKEGWNTFYSVEPLLEKVDLQLLKYPTDWVIVGGESGLRSQARQCHLEWILDVINQCHSSKIPAFVKQLGTNPHWRNKLLRLQHIKGGNFLEFPECVQVREFPKAAVCTR